MDYPAHPVILSYNKLPCINRFQSPSRLSCQWKPDFKQRFHQIHSVYIVLRLVRHDLMTVLLVPWSQNDGIQYLVILENWPNHTPLHEFVQFLGCDPHSHTHTAKTCLSAWTDPGMGYVMHFLTPTTAYEPAYI